MIFGGNVNGDPREFMYYKGDIYINGSQFTVKDSYIENHTYNDKKIWKYAKFTGTMSGPSGVMYYFWRDKYSFCDLWDMGYTDTNERNNCLKEYAPFFVVSAYELDDVIEEFTHPIILPKEDQAIVEEAIEDIITNPKKDWDYPELRVGWLFYIVAMVGSLIFNQFYILWAIATYIFITYRKNIIN